MRDLRRTRWRPGPVLGSLVVVGLLVALAPAAAHAGSPPLPRPSELAGLASTESLRPGGAAAVDPSAVGITSFTVSPNPDESGVPANLTVSTAGGSGALSYRYEGLPPYCEAANVSLLSCAPSEPGTYQVNVTVNDSAGGGAVANLLWVVAPRLGVGPVQLNPPVTDSYEGETITLNISGGVKPFQITWTGLPDECIPNGTAYIHCFPGDPGSYLVEGHVTDVLKVSGFAAALFGVVAPPSVSRLLILPGNITLGQNVTFVTLARAGSGLVSYAYSGLPPGCASVNASYFACRPTQNGSFNVTVIAFDQYNGASERAATLNVSLPVAPQPRLVLFEAAPARVVEGQNTDLVGVILNGSGAWNVTYTGLPPGCSSSSTLDLRCRPNTTGNFSVRLTARDAAGGSVTGLAPLAVVSAPPVTKTSGNSSAPPAPSVYPAVGAGLVGGLLAGVAGGWLIARRQQNTTERRGDPG